MGKMQSMMLMYAMMLSGGIQHQERKEFLERNYESEEQKQKRLQEEEIRLNIKRGLRPFEFGETIIWATNQKNADRKAKKLRT